MDIASISLSAKNPKSARNLKTLSTNICRVNVYVRIYVVFLTDDWQPSPLVTLTEESELALRDKSFQKLLKKMGLVPPTNEQVRFA